MSLATHQHQQPEVSQKNTDKAKQRSTTTKSTTLQNISVRTKIEALLPYHAARAEMLITAAGSFWVKRARQRRTRPHGGVKKASNSPGPPLGPRYLRMTTVFSPFLIDPLSTALTNSASESKVRALPVNPKPSLPVIFATAPPGARLPFRILDYGSERQ